MKTLILDTVGDLVSDFVFYDRKEDEELSVKALKQAFRDGTITVEEVVQHFKAQLEKGLG